MSYIKLALFHRSKETRRYLITQLIFWLLRFLPGYALVRVDDVGYYVRLMKRHDINQIEVLKLIRVLTGGCSLNEAKQIYKETE